MNYYVFKILHYNSKTFEEYTDCGIVAADNYSEATDKIIKDYNNCLIKIFIEESKSKCRTLGIDEIEFFNNRLNKIKDSNIMF